MTTATRRPPVALIALLAAITASSGASMADTPPANDGVRYADARSRRTTGTTCWP